MAGFDEKIVMMNEGLSHRSDQALDKEVSLNHEQINFEENDSFEMAEEKPNSRGSLGERIAARAGFNAPKLNTQIIRSTDFSLNSDIRSPCLTISSPGLSPATLLESPVFLSNPLAQPSPTTGKFSFFPGGNNHTLSSSPDKSKDEFFDDINASFTFQPVSRSLPSFIPTTTTKVVPVFQNSFPNTEISIDYGNCNTFRIVEDIKPDPQNIHGNVLGSSAERYNNGNEIDQGDQNMGDYHRQDEEQREEDVGDMVAGGPPAEDGYNWRKYGQKLVKGSEYPRSYYKCTHPNCLVKKKVERSREGHITEIIYKGSHNHPKPLPNRRSAIGSSGLGVDVQQIDGTDQVDQQNGLVRDSEETSPVSGGFEYGNQSGLMQVQHESGDATAVLDASSTFSNDDDDDDRGTHASVSLGYDGEGDETESKRRKLEAYTTEMSGATRANREPRVVVQTTSDVDILDDGYRWRKYGQKVVKGNPNPRSYYKCTAPGCTVRKHVERASHDLKAVITTYDGKHNHGVPVARTNGHGGGSGTGQVGGSVTQTQSEPRHHRFDRPVTSNHPPPFGHPFSFQPQLGHPPPGFSFDLTIPVLTFGQQNLPGFPMHPYLTAPPPPPQPPVVGSRSTEPKVEPMSETGLGLSGSSSIYRQIMSKLPHI